MWVMGIKEGTCYDEYWVLYVSDESLNSAPETNIILYVNELECKQKSGEKKPKISVITFSDKVTCAVTTTIACCLGL